MAQLREQSRAKREAEHRNADSTIKRYGTMLSFPDESRHAEMKLLEEHMTGESLQNKQVALERKNAGKLARTQLSHYNLLTFDEDEFKVAHAHTKTWQKPAVAAASKEAPQQLATRPAGATTATRASHAPTSSVQLQTNVDMPAALELATRELAAARAQIAQDTLTLAARPLPLPQPAAARRAPVGREGGGAHREAARPVAVAHTAHAVVRRGGADVEEREADKASHAKSMLSWDGKGIPRF